VQPMAVFNADHKSIKEKKEKNTPLQIKSGGFGTRF
jgi:hypothetical protein